MLLSGLKIKNSAVSFFKPQTQTASSINGTCYFDFDVNIPNGVHYGEKYAVIQVSASPMVHGQVTPVSSISLLIKFTITAQIKPLPWYIVAAIIAVSILAVLIIFKIKKSRNNLP
jgi:hypothetical protein